MDILLEKLTPILLDLVVVLVGVVATFLAAWLKEKLGTDKVRKINEQLKLKSELAKTAVLFVQQAYEQYNGDRKLKEATKFLSNRLVEHGIILSPDEIHGLIESALKEAKRQFAEEWKK